MNYDEDMLQVRLDDPYFDGEGFSHVKFCWQRYYLLSALNNTIRGYGEKDDGLLFSRLKFNLKAVCDSIIEAETFRENFIHSIMIHCLRNAMRSIDEELNIDSKPFCFLYSLSIMNLLNLLNVFRRSSCTDVELTDSTLLTERVGCMLGVLLVQCTKMVRKANEVISGIRSNCHSSCDVDKIIGFNEDTITITIYRCLYRAIPSHKVWSHWGPCF